MMAPALASQIKEPADILKLNLIDGDDPWWAAWFAAAGVAETPAIRPALNFNSQTLAASAAIAGHGVAILTPAFHRIAIARGLLVQPFDLVCSQGRGYYLVLSRGTAQCPPYRRVPQLDTIGDIQALAGCRLIHGGADVGLMHQEHGITLDRPCMGWVIGGRTYPNEARMRWPSSMTPSMTS